MFFTGTIAVVGATNNPERVAYTIIERLKKRFVGQKIIPVHPTEQEIQGLSVSHSIHAITEPIDTLVLLVNPRIAFEVVQEALAKGITKFWFQPGTYDQTIMDLLATKDVETSYGACVLHL